MYLYTYARHINTHGMIYVFIHTYLFQDTYTHRYVYTHHRQTDGEPDGKDGDGDRDCDIHIDKCELTQPEIKQYIAKMYI